MQYLLHIDTSTDTGMVAVCGDGAVIARTTNIEARNHAAAINNMIAQATAEAGITLADVAAIAVCAGPGSYTGLRIGMATAKGLCYALDKPLIAQNRLELLAYGACRQQGDSYAQYVSLLVARDKEYFTAVYDREMKCLAEPQHVLEAGLQALINKKEKTYIISNAPAGVVEGLNMEDAVIYEFIDIDLYAWARYAFEKYNSNDMANLRDAEPFYLKQVYTHK